MMPPYQGPGYGIPHTMPDYNRAMMHVMPVIRHSLREIKPVGVKHAITEASLIAYLIGKGYDFYQAVRIVESWERNESFPM